MKSVIGLVGEAGVGKGEVSKILIATGFRHYSLSDSLRNVATDLGLSHDREILIKIGNTLRERFGGDILARGAKEWLDKEGITGNIVIESIRNPAEVRYLQKELGVFVIGITMSPEKRFELMRDRKREGDPQTWEEFQKLLQQEQGNGEKVTGQQLQKCLELSDVLLSNEKTKDDLSDDFRELLSQKGIIFEGHKLSKEIK